MDVKVEVEYCGSCGYSSNFEELATQIRSSVPTAAVSGKEGRRGSFEVSVNGTLVYSKLSTMAFPDFKNVTDIVSDAAEGKNVAPVLKQQPIDCIIV
ncbi:migration and invasion enhancer 1 [Zootermopsis nevadensis]|uniref:migration and invasion enhancer 1 n=1 Tax=Zootermopsis nevadensis TaxID=136037 RepID=UPI000B8E2592|nr:migration and invasion enhancer 1 [Zootermopsis nevadensis]